jgi:hypothetical protein
VVVARHALVAGLLVVVPRAAQACPVCFGENDSPLTAGVRMGVLFMLGLVGLVLAGFASFIVHLARRARLADESSTVPDAAARYGASPQEESARC